MSEMMEAGFGLLRAAACWCLYLLFIAKKGVQETALMTFFFLSNVQENCTSYILRKGDRGLK
jgi:hypothetical protein